MDNASANSVDFTVLTLLDYDSQWQRGHILQNDVVQDVLLRVNGNIAQMEPEASFQNYFSGVPSFFEIRQIGWFENCDAIQLRRLA